MPILEAQNLRKSYRQGKTTTHAVQGVSLSLNSSEILAFLGPSSAGKTAKIEPCRDRQGSPTMSNQETAIAKIRQLPEPLLKLVNDFLDVLLRAGGTQPDSHSSQSLATAKPKPTFGSAKGMIWIADDFNEPLEDFKEYME